MSPPRTLALALLLSLAACRGPLPGPWPPIEATVQEYRIGPGDIIRVAVYGNADLSGRVTVRPDGRISLSLVNEVTVAGRTVAEVARELSEGYRRFVQDARVSVIVEEVHSYRVYVMGKVTHPGDVESRVPVTVMQALTLAGGFARAADMDRIIILRRAPNGQEERFLFSYTECVNGRTEMNFTLRTGDTIIVP
ncbi:MAG: polysaccharide biosynthesis/export family protein [Deltaproteobacteria bacterium]|nr:polysaccharide biosynthesis/export family protein [Deltaproteobacteria bacterium]